MKYISSVIFIPATALAVMSIPSATFAMCPPQLTPDDMHECIMMEGNGDLNYREWAPEFYKEFKPGKTAAINAAYQAEDMKMAQENGAPLSVSVSSAQ